LAKLAGCPGPRLHGYGGSGLAFGSSKFWGTHMSRRVREKKKSRAAGLPIPHGGQYVGKIRFRGPGLLHGNSGGRNAAENFDLRRCGGALGWRKKNSFLLMNACALLDHKSVYPGPKAHIQHGPVLSSFLITKKRWIFFASFVHGFFRFGLTCKKAVASEKGSAIRTFDSGHKNFAQDQVMPPQFGLKKGVWVVWVFVSNPL